MAKNEHTLYYCGACGAADVQLSKLAWVGANERDDYEQIDYESTPGSMGYSSTWCPSCEESDVLLRELELDYATAVDTFIWSASLFPPDGIGWPSGEWSRDLVDTSTAEWAAVEIEILEAFESFAAGNASRCAEFSAEHSPAELARCWALSSQGHGAGFIDYIGSADLQIESKHHTGPDVIFATPNPTTGLFEVSL